MATARDPLEPILAKLRDASRLSRRNTLRRHAQAYRRDGRILLYWCFPPSRPAARAALADPECAEATRQLCRALWRDLRTARALPRYLTGRGQRIDSLRLLFAGECMLYRRQRAARTARPDLAARPLTTGEWLTDLCRRLESPAAVVTAAKREPRPRRAGQPPLTRARIPDQGAGTGNTRRRSRPDPP